MDEIPGGASSLPEFFEGEKVVGSQGGQLMTEDLDGTLHFLQPDSEEVAAEIAREETIFEAHQIIDALNALPH